MNYQAITDNYYCEDNSLRHILLEHSRAVADKALRIADAHTELGIDRQFVEEAAMLHDIGIFRCDAPGIECHGTEPYIRHGRIGAELLRAEGFPRHARVCERHTGAGLSLEDIVSHDLPLPHQSFLPETIEEILVCYADKFFSKTRLDREKTFDEAERSIAKYGSEGLARFREWHRMFAEDTGDDSLRDAEKIAVKNGQ